MLKKRCIHRILKSTTLNFNFTLIVQGVSENMQQLLTSTKIWCKPWRIKVIYQIQAYYHTILLIIKNPENDTK